jgi:hypothetical protein
LIDPGPRPVIGYANPTSIQLGVFANTIKVWEFEMQNFIKQEEAIANLKAQYLSFLDENSRRLVDHPVHGTMVITIQQIRNILKSEYGTLTPGDVDTLFEQATASYSSGTDMRCFLYSKVNAYAELAAAGEVFGAQTTTRYLIASLRSEGTFDDVILFWHNTNTTVESQVLNASHYPRH